MCGENNWEGRCNAAQERARKTNEWLSGGEFVSRSSPLICLCGMRPLRAAALPVKPRAIHYRSSFALCPRRLAAVEGNGPPSQLRAMLKKHSSYRSHHSPATTTYIRHAKHVRFFPHSERSIPHFSKKLPLNPKITFETRKTTFEVFQNVSNIILAFRER